MIIKSIKIQNLQLIQSVETTFDKINIVSGLNKDTPNESGNGSGKSTMVLRAILFCLYGYCEEGLTLKDLIRFGEKETSVEIELEKDNEQFRIIRKIPSDLQIFFNNKEIQANTLTIKQQFISEHFGDVNFFKQYRCVDNKNGINILDMGIVSVRKTLMSFIEGIFTDIRTRLLAKKVERERYSVDKKLYKHYLSEKRLNILNTSLDEIKSEYHNLEIENDKQQGVINKLKSEIQTREKLIYNQKKTIEDTKNSGICPVLKTKCLQISKSLTSEHLKTMNKYIDQMSQEIVQYLKQLESELDSLKYYNDSLSLFREKENKAREKLMRLKGAFQFADYKYTKADIIIYDEAIKVLDTFAGEYIKEWLGSLSIIINNLLNPLNIEIEFSADKDFLKVKDNNQILKYDQLSTGQRCFLSTIFKLSILLQQNKSGIILLDDGLNNLDLINFKNLIEITKTLPFQLIAVYQGYDNSIEDIKQILIIREKGISNVDVSSQK